MSFFSFINIGFLGYLCLAIGFIMIILMNIGLASSAYHFKRVGRHIEITKVSYWIGLIAFKRESLNYINRLEIKKYSYELYDERARITLFNKNEEAFELSDIASANNQQKTLAIAREIQAFIDGNNTSKTLDYHNGRMHSLNFTFAMSSVPVILTGGAFLFAGQPLHLYTVNESAMNDKSINSEIVTLGEYMRIHNDNAQNKQLSGVPKKIPIPNNAKITSVQLETLHNQWQLFLTLSNIKDGKKVSQYLKSKFKTRGWQTSATQNLPTYEMQEDDSKKLVGGSYIFDIRKSAEAEQGDIMVSGDNNGLMIIMNIPAIN